LREKPILRFVFLSIVRKRKDLRLEPRLKIAASFAPGKIVKVGGEAVRWKDRQALAAGVDERHHGKIVGRGRVGSRGMKAAGGEAALVAVIQRGFITMMAVGDYEFVLFHGGFDGGGAIVIGDDSQAMHHAVFIAQRGCRRGGLGVLQDGIYALLRIRIEHKELAGLRARVAKKFEAVGFGARERVLVAKDNASGVVLEFAGADEAAACALFAGAGDSVFLGISVERRKRILNDNVFVDPALEGGGGARVDIVLRGIVRIRAAFFDGDEVIRVGGVIIVLHGWRDFVVRLREDAFERDTLGVVAKRLEGVNLGHVVWVSGRILCRAPSSIVYAKWGRF